MKLNELTNADSGFKQLRADLDAFISRLLESGEITSDVAIRLRKAFSDAKAPIDALGVAIGQSLANGVAGLVDVIGSADKSFREFAANFLKQIAKMIAQQIILNSLKSTFPSFFNSAHGNAFTGRTGLPQGIYPPVAGGWMFPMQGVRPMNFAFGGTIGRLAEAGRAEAIVPLVRHGGDLGVKASPVNIIVNNTASNDTKVEIKETNRPDGGKDISFLVRRELATAMGDGSMDRQMRSVYGLRRQGV
jgi:hypothetical protein